MADRTHDDAVPILEVRDIVKSYGGVVALKGVSLQLRAGEVLCLAGENGCGKSTLIKVISGVERPDSGEIVVDGTAYAAMDPAGAIKSGIQVIYQDFSLFPNLTVAENIVLTSLVERGRHLFSAKRTRPAARRIVDELGLMLDLDAEVGTLSVADRQLTAVCRALTSDARIVIMDEPTTALTHAEVARLFALVERLRERGVALMFVSHKLDEVLSVSQRVTILRSGAHVITALAAKLDRHSIAQHMTGQDIDDARSVAPVAEDAPTVLEVKGLSLRGCYDQVSFDVRAGEIIGIAGLLGSGRTEIAESLFGVLPAESGTVRIGSSVTAIRSTRDALRAGIGYVPEDRLSQGLFLNKSISDNIIAASLSRFRGGTGLLRRTRVTQTTRTFFDRLRIKAATDRAPVRSLSGGNAQRVVLAKWLATSPKVLVLNGPTVGVDVGSKHEILNLLRIEASRGMAIVIVSDDTTELVSCCHRVLIVRRGQIVHELAGDAVTQERVLERIAG